MVKAVKKKEASAAAYSKAQMLSTKRLAAHRDIVAALLENDKTYTLDEAERLIQAFLMREAE